MPKRGSSALLAALKAAAAKPKSDSLFYYFGHHYENSTRFVLTEHRSRSVKQLQQVDRFCQYMTTLVARKTGFFALHSYVHMVGTWSAHGRHMVGTCLAWQPRRGCVVR